MKTFYNESCVVNAHKKRIKTCPVLPEEMELNILCYAEENHITPLRITERIWYFKKLRT
jgi:hypothetical protein